ncbi:MAG TPA: Ig-like domain-containing protein [Gemmatimonadales bacterium]|nr:Ig-like domain-containing protein [Gemmatimonadales bacterium]
MYTRCALPGALIVVAALTACDLKRQPTDPTSSPITRVVVRPESVALDPQQTQPFQAYGVTAAGDSVPATVSWSATNGSVTAGGLYTADTSTSDGVVTAMLSTAQVSGSGHVRKRRLVQIIVTPTSASVQEGQSQQFAAYGRRNTGDTVAVNVTYSATGGTITQGGMYTAGTNPGTFRVIARENTTSLQDTSAVSVTSAPPPPPGNPGTVSNLSVGAVTDSSVTLSFTEVTDGTGQPASYDIRWAAGTISWGSATPVASGTCSTPLAGSAVGATKTCTVRGLAAGTAYQFQALAFRGTLNVDAVFGLLSNVASGTTTASTAPVATVTVSPATGSVGIGQTVQLVATPKDAAGNTLTGRSITWSSGAPLLASVNGSGLVSGLLAGIVPITATSEGKSGSSSITVAALPPPTNLFPNEPSGLSLIQESNWETGLLGSWFRKFTSTDKPITIVPISDSPIGESQALQIGYNAGHVGGGGTELEYDIPTLLQPREMFVGYYVQVSSNWQGHSSAINKMVYLDDGGATFSAMWYEMFGSGSSPLGLYVVNQSGSGPAGMHENVQAVNFTRGAWHKVEIYQKQGSPGIIRVWVDGVLAIDRSDVFTRDAAIGMVTISGIWGGIDDVKQHFDYMRFDNIHISGR